jgi:dihydropteroate synthase
MMNRREWKIGGRVIDLSRRGMIMGVLNVTPDSFSDGGKFFDRDSAVAHAVQLASEGADIIDVGGESTRPGSEPISPNEELGRVIPVIEQLARKIDKLISIDTSKAAVAEAALKAGASIVNDVTGGRGDAEMMSLVARHNCGFIIMHMQGEPRTMQKAPRYDDVVVEVRDFFRQQFARALECGVDAMTLAFDPGIGFGKTLDHNLDLLANLAQLRVEDRPIVIGVSRKSSLGKLVGSDAMQDRHAATVALTGLLRGRGGDVFRVHDVKDNVRALRAAEAILER